MAYLDLFKTVHFKLTRNKGFTIILSHLSKNTILSFTELHLICSMTTLFRVLSFSKFYKTHSDNKWL